MRFRLSKPPPYVPEHGVKPDWQALYRDSLSRSEVALGVLADGVFTVWSFAVHVMVYFVLWIVIDWGPFLNAISVEAVIVSLCVGVNTKLQLKGDRVAQQQRDWLEHEIEKELLDDKATTEAIHNLAIAIHHAVVEPDSGRGCQESHEPCDY
jgi:hypothetical protein